MRLNPSYKISENTYRHLNPVSSNQPSDSRAETELQSGCSMQGQNEESTEVHETDNYYFKYTYNEEKGLYLRDLTLSQRASWFSNVKFDSR